MLFQPHLHAERATIPVARAVQRKAAVPARIVAQEKAALGQCTQANAERSYCTEHLFFHNSQYRGSAGLKGPAWQGTGLLPAIPRAALRPGCVYCLITANLTLASGRLV